MKPSHAPFFSRATSIHIFTSFCGSTFRSGKQKLLRVRKVNLFFLGEIQYNADYMGHIYISLLVLNICVSISIHIFLMVSDWCGELHTNDVDILEVIETICAHIQPH